MSAGLWKFAHATSGPNRIRDVTSGHRTSRSTSGSWMPTRSGRITVRGSRSRYHGATAADIAARWAGVLPQHAPTIRAPASRISTAVRAIVSGLAL